jgi:hypothetical protein
MSDVKTLLTCPDCGGILEPSRPAWAATLDVAAALDAVDHAPAAWRCLICGYAEAVPDTAAAPQPGAPPF